MTVYVSKQVASSFPDKQDNVQQSHGKLNGRVG